MELKFSGRIISGIIFMCTVAFSSNAADSLRVEQENGQQYVIHQVEKGETLYSISRRYRAGIEVIGKQNNIIDNQLALGQLLKIPVEGFVPVVTTAEARPHTVTTGETLYSLSRKYGVSLEDLKAWNELTSNAISIGQTLLVGPGVRVAEEPVQSAVEVSEPVKAEEVEAMDDAKVVEEGFTTYYVQSGDLIEGIAKKFNVRPDSLVIWNKLPNTYLAIGQKLLVKGDINAETKSTPSNEKITAYGTIRRTTDESGFTKIFEEGIAGRIDSSVETDKYLALHRTLKVGTLLEVRNLMNNQRVFVRIVGKLPETGLNANLLVRLTPVCFERLAVIDPKARVEVSYYEE